MTRNDKLYKSQDMELFFFKLKDKQEEELLEEQMTLMQMSNSMT